MKTTIIFSCLFAMALAAPQFNNAEFREPVAILSSVSAMDGPNFRYSYESEDGTAIDAVAQKVLVVVAISKVPTASPFHLVSRWRSVTLLMKMALSTHLPFCPSRYSPSTPFLSMLLNRSDSQNNREPPALNGINKVSGLTRRQIDN